MVVQQILYADAYTEKIAKKISEDYKVQLEFHRLYDRVFDEWRSFLRRQLGTKPRTQRKLSPNALLLGGNRWRHHYALPLSDLPIVVLDAHSDMSYDEMTLFHLVRPYNWIYFKLKHGTEVHLIIQRFNSLKRRDIVVPRGKIEKFHLYSFDRENNLTRISAYVLGSSFIPVKDPEESCVVLAGRNKEISLDFDITRAVSQDRVEKLIENITKDGDVYDIWLDEGTKGNRKTLEEQIECCTRIFKILDGK